MSPDQLAVATIVLKLLEMIGIWPFAVLLFAVVVGPWVLAILLAYSYRRRYESNVRLVEDYHSVASDLKSVIVLNTQTIATLIEDVRTNQYCPHVRLVKIAEGRQTDGA